MNENMLETISILIMGRSHSLSEIPFSKDLPTILLTRTGKEREGLQIVTLADQDSTKQPCEECHK